MACGDPKPKPCETCGTCPTCGNRPQPAYFVPATFPRYEWWWGIYPPTPTWEPFTFTGDSVELDPNVPHTTTTTTFKVS